MTSGHIGAEFEWVVGKFRGTSRDYFDGVSKGYNTEYAVSFSPVNIAQVNRLVKIGARWDLWDLESGGVSSEASICTL